MHDFMLLLYNQADDFGDLSPDEMQTIVERYKAWGDRLEREGRLLGSDKLADDEGRVLRRVDGRPRVLDGPYSETKEVIGGYFAFSAADYDEALEIAQGCPHYELGHLLELRRIDPH